MDHDITSTQPCIDACTHCHQTCLQMAMTHCLQLGGQHVEPEHFALMLQCAELCQTCANFQLSGSAHAMALCAVCAEMCEACADSCEAIGDMDACVSACRACAESCASMAA